MVCRSSGFAAKILLNQHTTGWNSPEKVDTIKMSLEDVSFSPDMLYIKEVIPLSNPPAFTQGVGFDVGNVKSREAIHFIGWIGGD
jgi:hypothetical protein